MSKDAPDKTAQYLWDKTKKHFDAHDHEQSMAWLDQIAELADVDEMILMKAANTRGLIYFQRNNLKNAEMHLLISLDHARNIGDPLYICSRYDNLAAIYAADHQLKAAIDHLEASLLLKEKSGNEKGLPATLLNLMNLHIETGDTDAAEKTLKESIYFIKKYGYEQLYSHYYYGMGMLHTMKKEHKDAVDAYSKTIRYALRTHDYTTAAKAYSNQGERYLDLHEWADAKRKFTRALKIAQEHKLRGVDLMASVQLGIIALEQGDLKRSRKLYEYVNANTVATDFDFLFKDLEELRSRLYEAEGNYKPALDAYKKYLSFYKKQYDNEMNRSVKNIQAKYEAEKKDRALEKSKLLQVQSELKALRAQMDPHFIFNALSSMRKELLGGNPEGADAYLVRFSKLLRLILDTSRTPEIRLSDNIELLHLYIQIERTRQGDKFDYSIVTKGIDPDSTFIPGLILQPLAENAIVHGLYHKKNGKGKLRISFSKAGNALVIKMRDNGVGRKASKAKAKAGHISHAMSIIRETLELTWQGRNVKNYFTIKDMVTKDNINIGTEVTVLLPLS